MKITDQELQAIRKNREELETVAEEFSKLSLQMVVLENMVKLFKTKFLELTEKEDALLSELQKKYGDGLLDIESGEIKNSIGE